MLDRLLSEPMTDGYQAVAAHNRLRAMYDPPKPLPAPVIAHTDADILSADPIVAAPKRCSIRDEKELLAISIQIKVAQLFDIDPMDMMHSPECATHYFYDARAIAMLLIKQRCGYPNKALGYFFDVTETPVRHGIAKAERYISMDPAFADLFEWVGREVDRGSEPTE